LYGERGRKMFQQKGKGRGLLFLKKRGGRINSLLS